MVSHSRFKQLPPAAKAEFDRILREGNFSNYLELCDKVNKALADQGIQFTFSLSAVKRRGKELQNLLEKIRESQEISRYLLENCTDDDDEVFATAAARLAKYKIFALLLKSESSIKEISIIARTLFDLSRAQLSQYKFIEELRSKLDKEVAELEKPGQLDQDALRETLKRIKREVYGFIG